MHDAGAWLRLGRFSALRRRRYKRLDKLMPETDDFVGAHVAPDHAVRQPLLEWLVDDAAIVREIGSAAHHELSKR